MFPLNITHVSLRHYSCFPSTLLMFTPDMTHVSARHCPPLPADLVECTGISAPRPPEPSPCTVTALGRFSPAARAGAGRGVWYNPADGLMLAEMRLRRLRAGGSLKSISGTRPACCGTCLALQCIRAFSSNRSPLSVFWGASALNAARSLIERGRRPCFLSGASVLRTVTIRKAKK